MTVVPADDLPDSPAPQARASTLVPDDDLPSSDAPTTEVAPKADAPPMSEAQRLGTGAMDPLVGLAQIGGHAVGALPAPVGGAMERANDFLADLTGSPKSPRGLFTGEGADAAVKRREASIPPEPGGGRDLSRLTGNIISPANMVAPARALVSKALPAIGRVGSRIVQGGVIGAMQPATGSNFGVEKGLQVGLGGAAGAVTTAAQELGLPPLINWLTGVHGEAAIQDRAVQTVLKRIQNDQKGGGASFQDMLDLANATPEKPLVLADVADANAKGLLGKIARTPGEAKQQIATFMRDRDLDAGTRVTGDINKEFGSDPAYFADQALAKARSQAAKPLFDKARAGGSIAPLETQFRNTINAATKAESDAASDATRLQSELTSEMAKTPTGPEGIKDSTRIRELSAARDKAIADHATSTNAKGVALKKFSEVQADIAAGTKGAVWSPRLQEFLDHPDVQQGIKRGWKIERNDALAEGRPIVDSEYAITGYDEAGDPIVGKVPTMKLLMVAKEGIDAMLEDTSMRTQFGELNKMGVSIDKVRHELVSELDRLNPDYKPARESWSGHTDSRIALKDGQKVFSTEPEKIKYLFENEFTDSEKEFYRLGAANVMRKMVSQTGRAGDETRRLIGSDYAKRQLRSLFGSDKEFDDFFKSLNAEHMMFDTWSKTYGGSNSADKLAEDLRPEMNAASHAVRAGAAAHSGWWPGAISHGMQAVGRVLPNTNPAALKAQAGLLTSPVPEAVQILQGATARAPQSRVAPYVIPGLVELTSPDMNSQ